MLDAATKLKMTHEEDDENKIILKAITDVNLPKFSSSDTQLFQVRFLYYCSNIMMVVIVMHVIQIIPRLGNVIYDVQ